MSKVHDCGKPRKWPNRVAADRIMKLRVELRNDQRRKNRLVGKTL
jgi:hypothetical protein